MMEYAGARAARAQSGRFELEQVGAFVRRLDWALLLAVAALVGYGLLAIAGITRHDVAGSPDYYVVRQGIFAALGLVGLLAALCVDPGLLQRGKRTIYIGTTSLMAVVFLAGTVA